MFNSTLAQLLPITQLDAFQQRLSELLTSGAKRLNWENRCSPFRVPVARLAAAHAALREQG